MNFTTRQKMIVENCVRRVLCDLLDREQVAIDDFTAGLHNINIGSFGDKDYKFDDTNDWIGCLQDMRDIIALLDPKFEKHRLELGSEDYRLPEEDPVATSEPTYFYCVQWLDDGGPWDNDLNEEMVWVALEQMGLSYDVIVDTGAVQLKGDDAECFTFIQTKVELPEWVYGGRPNINLRGNMPRFVEEIKLWFYTFTFDQNGVECWYSLSEWDEINRL